MEKQKTLAHLERDVFVFNHTYRVGDRVKVEMDNGEIKVCTVASPATVMGGHSAMGWFEEISGCYSLDRIR